MDLDAVIVFDLVIGNKRVMKDTPVFAAGSPYTFANTANSTIGGDEALTQTFSASSSIHGRRWYFDSATSSMVCGLPHF
jgi:hypothetical protein